uniref:Uncharacterized protein n=1 Tax=Solanum tuberosum TaxID=4113 RepID=M1DAA5_SOLTU
MVRTTTYGHTRGVEVVAWDYLRLTSLRHYHEGLHETWSRPRAVVPLVVLEAVSLPFGAFSHFAQVFFTEGSTSRGPSCEVEAVARPKGGHFPMAKGASRPPSRAV